MARGFGFRMVEAMGIIDRRDVAQDVKNLDQEARGLLRKHGIRFGQFTIFMQALLKPAPTRLRLVLWSLANGADEFPESPPPGLVTIPHIREIPSEIYLMSGYKPAGDRAIRIDMLERLADLLRAEDSRSGFEANPDMLSITGMTLDQFANLMEGLGYKAVRGEREKPAPVTGSETPTDAAGPDTIGDVVETVVDDGTAQITETAQAPDTDAKTAAEGAPPPEVATDETPTGEAADATVDQDRIEVFYTFTWGGNRSGNQQQRRGKPQGKREGKPRGKGKPRREGGGGGGKPRNFEARPPKKDRIDPDNPFAQALMGLKTKDE